MTLPEGVEQVTVTADGVPLTLPDGTPMQGRLTFTGPALATVADDSLIFGGSVRRQLVDGLFEDLTLVATDATGISPTGFTYRVDAALTNGAPWTRYISLPQATPTAVLAGILITDPVEGEHATLVSLDGVTAADVGALDLDGGTLTGSLALASSFDGGEDDGTGTDTTNRINLYSYQRADVGSFGETIRHFAMRKDAKQMEAWYFPAGGYDVNREPLGSFTPVVWAGAHWEANDHVSNHKHWSVETPDTTGAIQTRFEVRWGDPNTDDAIAGLDKTLIMTNLADLVVRCSNGQELRLSAPAGNERSLMFSLDSLGGTQYRRWQIRATSEAESGGNAGTNWQLVRYDDAGVFIDAPLVVSRSTGNVTITPGFIARRASSSASSLSLNTTSLGGGVGVIAIGNAATPSPNTPTGGGVLYAEGGALKWKGSSGTVTTIAPA